MIAEIKEAIDFWIILGLIGQVMFSLRFIVQWIASERRKESVVPIHFWFLSIGGSTILLAYAIHIRDPIFILGQAFGTFIYFRNLNLIYKKRRQETAS